MPTIPELLSKVRGRLRASRSQRTTATEDEQGDDTEEVDGVDAPKPGSTIEDPPNGGVRAWLIVVSCSVINLLIGAIEPLVLFALLDLADDTKLETGDATDIYQLFLSLSSVYAPIASISMATLGYELTIHVGSWCLTLSFLILSFIKNVHGIKFLLYVIAGIGSSFIQLGVLVPVLEYFTTKRIRALMISKISRYFGLFLLVIVFVANGSAPDWKLSYRVCMGLSLVIGLVGLTIPSLKLTMKSDGRTSFIARTLGMSQIEVTKNVFLWLVCTLFFIYHIAIEPPNAELTNIEEIPDRLKIEDTSSAAFAFFFTPVIGLILGAFLGWLFKFSVKRKFCGYMKEVPTTDEQFNLILIFIVAATHLMAIMCFIAPETTSYSFHFIFSILFSTQLALIEELRDDIIPNLFGQQNVKFVEGIIQMFVGFGGLIGAEGSSSLNNWERSFRLGGSMMFVTAAVSVLLLYLRKQPREYISKITKLLAIFSDVRQVNERSPESQTYVTRSRRHLSTSNVPSRPPNVAAIKTSEEIPIMNRKFSHTFSDGPSNVKFIVPGNNSKCGGFESEIDNEHNSESDTSNTANIQDSVVQGSSTGHTIFTNIHTSMSPVSYNVAPVNQLPNVYYIIRGEINSASENIIYSYNTTQNLSMN